MRFDLNEKGLRRIFRDWQVKALEYLWTRETGAGSRIVWQHLDNINAVAHPSYTRSVSRASVIGFLNQMVDDELMTFEMESGKGGYHRLYSLKHELNTRDRFKSYIHNQFEDALSDFLHEE